MDLSERVAVSPQLPADEGVNQSVGQTPRNLLGAQSYHSASRDLRQSALTTDGWELQQPGGHSLKLEFQDSNLSPALSLLPANSGVEHNFTEYSFFHQSDNEFASLRAYPDISVASERFHVPPQDRTTQDSEHGSLSQHPLAQASVLSEELASSCCSLSQNSLSPGDENQQEEIAHPPLITTTEDTGSREKDSESPGKLVREATEDEMFFLRKDIPAQQLLECLQKDIGMLSSSSAVSSASGMSVKSIASLAEGSKSTKVCKSDTDQSMLKREGPPGEASPPHQQTQQPERGTNPGQSQTLSSEVCNITMGSRSTQPDDSTEALHRELLSEAERHSKHETESKNQQRKSPTPPGPSLTPNPTEMSECNSDVTRTNPGGVPWTGPFSGGTVQVHREQDLWSSGNQTGIEGSYLGFLPQSQSTPGVFRAPPKSTVKNKLGQLSVVESIKENSYLSDTATSLQPAVLVVEDHCPYMKKQSQEEATSAKVQSLPSLNYMQKVDAWRVNQTSLMSLFDSLALQGFSGISPKKKAYDAVSDTLNNILSQQVKSLQQPPISRAAHQTVTQNSSTDLAGSSSPRRGEALGSAPNDKDNTGSVARTGTSPFGRSQSHSSLSTVVMLVQKEETQDNAQQPSTTVQPSPLMSLGQFSDVSVDRDLTPSSSQDSYNGEVKLRALNRASSVTSLEVDNYAPYWTLKPSTPPPQPRHREFNIEERIPLYLHNLGIDQSPSTILTPFAPRGPIREPEFSPTDFCTIKGSIGTPTKSAQPSEGGSPHKGEFSRSSIWSVDTNVSIPFSLDSLGPAVSISDIEAIQIARRVASSSQSDEDRHFTILQPSQQQQKDTSLTSSQNAVQLGERFGSDVSLGTKLRCTERNFESPLQTSRTLNHTTEDSFVSSKIHKLMSRAENVVSTMSSSASSTSAAVPHLLSDGDIFLSLNTKTTRLQNSSFSSSSAAEDTRTRSSFLGARSSSDSMLTSEKPRQNLIGQKTMKSSWKPSYPSTQALITATAAHTGPQDGTTGSSLGLLKPARRAEPEGCSAAPPDSKVPTQPPVVKPLPPVSTQQLSSIPSDTVGAPEEKERTRIGGPAQSSSSSPILEDMDQGVVSDGSSESSLAVRVAKLLQSESPSTMVSSSTSITDQEDGKAREWIKLKISGQQCEPLVLDKEDREWIEEIKKELLLKNPMKSPGSTDTESNATSSVAVPLRQDPPLPAETFSTFSDVNNQLMQGLSTDQSDSSAQLQHPLPNLEAHVREIAAREGVSLPRTHPRALTSITIATRRRSTSSSRSMSPLSPAPDPLDLNELSTGAVDHPTNIKQLPPSQDEENKMTREPALVFEPSSSVSTRNQNPNSQLMSGNQKSIITVGAQIEECPTTSRNLHREDMNDLPVQDSSISGGHRADQATGSTACESPARSGHISHVHLTLSPKATDHSQAIAVHSSNADDFTGLPQKVFVPLRHSACVASSPDEGVGLSSPPEWFETREQIRQQGLEMTNASMLFKTVVPQGRITFKSTQSFTPRPRPEDSPGRLNTESPAVPVLLPYKPRGSEELFYVPQTEADFSSTAPSDTTMESSHTGSDDAVPPRFSSEVLGHQDPGLDRGVTIRHREGIYSKRFKTATFKMQQPEHTAAEKSTQTSENQAPKQSPLVSVAFTSVPISSNKETCKRDQGTSPVQFLSYDQPEMGRNALQPVHVEMDSDRTSHLNLSFVPQAEGLRDQQRTNPGVHYPASQQRTLDQLWQRFRARWSLEESRLTTEREASLLERLERLSHLIHSTRAANMSEQQGEEYNDPYSIKQKMGMRQKDAAREEKKQAVREDLLIHRRAWTQRLQVEETSQPAEDDSHASFTSTLSHTSFQSQHLCPADRDETETLSTTSGSMSTVDTARLIRAFGAHRVQHLKTSSSLSKLYSTINKQKEVREKSRGTKEDPPDIITTSETTGTDESVAADSASSTSTYTLPSHHGNPRSVVAKKAVKLVSKGIQAGDLEIVSNGTRRHTRDVGTTFPSPGETRAPIPISSSSFTAERRTGGQRSPSKSQGLQKQRKSKRSPSKPYPEGVSWFISVDDVRSEARKENQPEESPSSWRPSTTWFEPYIRRHAWREPLRQRQINEDRNQHPVEPDPRSKTVSSGLARISLQEALEMRCPGFISQSRQRVRRLALQVEERKLRAVFTRERGLFNQPGEVGRLPKPAATALLRRAVPRKEMIQRSKQIYENLPEVQRRREEERRKAEYRSFRLNAQLYNKRITNRVLGRRSVWQ